MGLFNLRSNCFASMIDYFENRKIMTNNATPRQPGIKKNKSIETMLTSNIKMTMGP